MATIQDVARLAGVSTATVSHVINKTHVVLPETQLRVEAAIEELQYQPSAVARGLATDTTHSVGIIVADITNPFFAQVVRGIEDRLAPSGYGLFVCNTDEQPEREARYLELLLRKRVDGLIIAPTGAAQRGFEQFGRRRTPIVYIDRRPPGPGGAFIGIDNVAAGYNATEHLLRQGHRRIGFLARHPNLYTVTGRLEGYRKALTDFGAEFEEQLVGLVSPSEEDAAEGANQLLAIKPKPTALITGNFMMTQGALQAIQARALRCPDDISLVCFDDHPWARLISPSLTVVAQPIEEILDAAAAALMEALTARHSRTPGEAVSGPDPEPASAEVLLDAHLIVRCSTRAASY